MLVTLTLILSFPAMAAEFQVTDAAGLQSALDTAQNNGQDDTIFLAAGNYKVNIVLHYEESRALVIQGEPGTTPYDVILDGDGKGSVMEAYFNGEGSMTISGLTVEKGTNGGLRLTCRKDSKFHLVLENIIIQDNSRPTADGGGVAVSGFANTETQLEIRNSVIRNNRSGRRSGGLQVETSGGNSVFDVLIVNSLVYGNQADWPGGGVALYASEVGDNNVTRGKILHSTITGNEAGTGEGGGGGVMVQARGTANASLDAYNTIVYGNTSDIQAQDLSVVQYDSGSSTVNAFNSNINVVALDAGFYNPTSVINGDPLFIDPVNDNYRLRSDSSCIDAGTAAVPSPPGLPATDFEGNPRISGPAPDIGAYEYVGSKINPDEGTIGTLLEITGAEFGTKKGKVSVGSSALKIIKWTTGWIQASLTKALSAGAYDVRIEPKGTEAIVIPAGFTFMEPAINSVEPASGSVNDEITLRGQFFGTKRGKVTLGGKNCRIKTWTMNASTGASEVRLVVPRGLSAGPHELKITNGVGSDTVNFTVD
jgi:hypothetical protein